jgi:ABC-type Fe3+-hydroxamate transport system substrate-binding protein
MIDPTTRISRNPDVVFRSLEEEQGGVLLHLQSGAYHGLNDFGCLVWGLLEQERTFRSLAEAVRAEAEDVPDSAEEELSSFVEQLRERDLLVTSG